MNPLKLVLLLLFVCSIAYSQNLPFKTNEEAYQEASQYYPNDGSSIALACSFSSITFAQNIKTITITDGADVKTLLGSDKDGVDSLVINGHIKQADISIIKNFCQDRKREIGLNLSGSTVEGDSLATDAFQGADVSGGFQKQVQS